MSEESATPDLAELTRGSIEAQEESIEAVMSFYAPDAVWDAAWGMGIFEGQEAVRAFISDWRSAYDEMTWEIEAIRELGNGITFAVIVQAGRVLGSSGSVQLRYASVIEWSGGLIVRHTTYTDIDEARASAERLAEQRGEAVSENLDLVRSIFEPGERGEFGEARWADREIEYTIVDGLEPSTFRGHAGLVEAMHQTLRPWERLETHVDRYRELDSQRVLVLTRVRGRGKASGLELEALSSEGAQLVHIGHGKVTRIDVYYDRERALADLGLAE